MSSQLSIGGRAIGDGEPAYLIAEAGINHNGSLSRAKRLVDASADAGVDAVKFQKRSLPETYREDIVEQPSRAELGVEYTVSNLKRVTLSDAAFRELAAYTREQSLDFLCSPWDEASVDFLETLDLPAYKIGSPDLTNLFLLERVLETGKPFVLSTGMAEESEIDRTVDVLEERGAEYALLHCRSTYPAPYHNLDLRFIEELDERYDVPVGYSGHERGTAVSSAAVGMGATILERHLTLDRELEGPDHDASLEPDELATLVEDVRAVETSRGSHRRYLTRGEYNNRVSLAKSLVTTRAIDAGETIGREALTAKSPAKGISPQEYEGVVGSTASRPIGADETLQWDDLDRSVEETYDPDLDGWGVVVRFSDIDDHDWGEPDLFEFRVNGADLDAEFDLDTYPQALGIHAPEQVGHGLVDPSATDESERERAVEIVQRTIDLTREEISPRFPATDRPPIVVHPGGVTRDAMHREDVPELNAALEQSLEELEEDGVEVLVENMPPLPWLYGGQQYHNNFMGADEIAAFCERTGRRICYDTSHAKLWCNYAGVDLVEHARTLRPYTAYLHVADAAGVDGEGLQIGDGEIDFERLMPVYDDFDGPIITEIWRGHERRGTGFKEAAERLGSVRQRVR
ncbi:N-acetylneuraminate synthase family protein [Natronococcus sp.]|uniref:N-acetylneuraminate synthase family protein n=1 Tax=Natronococcus sp. TaxID=35747 RepID=UPI0025F6543E|nr:N-acetylneuraminate synthase family protein [Natronococcus sp.]